MIDAVGEEVSGLTSGLRVATLSYQANSEWDLAEAGHVVALPAGLDGRPFPGEALGCAMNVFARSRVQASSTVAVVGIGFLGAVLTQLCASTGARVIGLSRRAFAQEVAREMGAAHVLPLGTPEEALTRVGELTGGELCDCVIEATGHQAGLDVASALVRVRGTLVIAGFHQDGPRQIDLQSWNWRGLDVVNAHERDPRVYVQGMRAACQAVAEGRLTPDVLYTHVFPLERLSDALEVARERPAGFLKALVTS